MCSSLERVTSERVEGGVWCPLNSNLSASGLHPADQEAMSGLTLNCINSSENEFLAEQTLITIIPNVDQPKFAFISGTFGPLTGGFPAVVPLWLAITLRKRGKCTVQIPEWMTVAALEARVTTERTQGTLSDLPFHYMEIAQLLITHAKEDIVSPDRVAVLLQDIENIRMDRIKLGVMGVADSISKNRAVVFANLNNASAMEILTMKRFFLSSMDTFYKLCPSVDAPPAFQGDGGESGAGGRKLRKFRNK
jgi:GINS complex subunit 2